MGEGMIEASNPNTDSQIVIDLQIFIPSYRREKPLKALLVNAINSGINELAQIHVTDDGPCEFIFLKDLSTKNLISVAFHDRNLGFAPTFIEALKNCKQEYLALVNDDDFIIRDGVVRSLEIKDLDFISTRYAKLDGTKMRDSEPTEVTISNSRTFSQHAPGLIFRISSSLKLIHYLEARISSDCNFTKTYPQLALLWLLLLTGHKARHFDFFIAQESYNCASQLSIGGYSYQHPVARFAQRLSALNFLDDLRINDEVDKEALQSLIKLERRGLGWSLYDAIRIHDSQLIDEVIISFLKERSYDIARKLRINFINRR